jgi:hypothetical protein
MIMTEKPLYGIILIILGIVLIIFAQSNALAKELSLFGTGVIFSEEDTLLKNIIFFTGLFMLVSGGIMTILGFQHASD